MAPMDELVYKRLQALQDKLGASLEHHAGLNPRAYRTMRMPPRHQVGDQRTYLSVCIVCLFVCVCVCVCVVCVCVCVCVCGGTILMVCVLL